MIRQIAMFAGVGVIATGTHLLVGSVLLSLHANPYLANTAGFLTAFFVSFRGHQTMTFKAGRSASHRAFWRYSSLAVTGFLFNQSVFFTLMSFAGSCPTVAMFIATCATAAITFVLAKYWVFRTHQH